MTAKKFCPRCYSDDPIDVQVQRDRWRGFEYAVMTCACGYGEAAPYNDLETTSVLLSSRFYRNGTRPSAVPELLEALRYAIDQVPELATVPGVVAAIAKATQP